MLLIFQVALLIIATIRRKNANPFLFVAILYGISFLAGIFFGITPDTVRLAFLMDYMIITGMIYFILSHK